MFGPLGNLIFDTVNVEVQLSRTGSENEQSKVSIFDADGVIEGKVIVSLPDKNKIYHYGLKLLLKQFIVFHDSADVAIELCSLTENLLPEGAVSTDSEFPFRLDLQSKLAIYHRLLQEKLASSSSSTSFSSYFPFAIPFLDFGSASNSTDSGEQDNLNGKLSREPDTVPVHDLEMNLQNFEHELSGRRLGTSTNLATNLHAWVESYEGIHFSIRQEISATLLRSWYANNVTDMKPFQLYKILKPSMFQLQEPVTLIVPDCGGKCIVELSSRFVEVGGTTNVTVTFQNMKKPITAMYFIILKAEHVEDMTMDRVVVVHRLFGIGSTSLLEDTPEDALYYAGYRSRVDEGVEDARPNDPVMIGAQFEMDLCTDVNMPFSSSSDDNDLTNLKIAATSHSGTVPVVHSPADGKQDNNSPVDPSRMRKFSGDVSAQSTPKQQHYYKRHSSQSILASTEDGRESPEPSSDKADVLFTPSFDSSALGLSASRLMEGSSDSKRSRDPVDLRLSTQTTPVFDTHTSNSSNITTSASPVPESSLKSFQMDGRASSSAAEDVFRNLRKTMADSTTKERNDYLGFHSSTHDAPYDDISRSVASSGELAEISLSGNAFGNQSLSSAPSSTEGATGIAGRGATAGIARGVSRLENTIAVRYYLRAVVQDSFDRICWNTTELILYRSESPVKPAFIHRL